MEITQLDLLKVIYFQVQFYERLSLQDLSFIEILAQESVLYDERRTYIATIMQSVKICCS